PTVPQELTAHEQEICRANGFDERVHPRSSDEQGPHTETSGGGPAHGAQTACRPARRERAMERRAVTKKFGPGDTTAKVQSAATESKIVIWSILYPGGHIHNR